MGVLREYLQGKTALVTKDSRKIHRCKEYWESKGPN